MQSALDVPAARRDGLVMTELKGEVVVYDEDRHHIHQLNVTAAAVWRLCDGQRTVADVARAAALDEEAVRMALRQLDDADLLASPLTTAMRGPGQSRRAFMKKAAVAGAMAVPAIVSVSAPHAAAASSTCNPCGIAGRITLCGCVSGVPQCIDGCCECT